MLSDRAGPLNPKPDTLNPEPTPPQIREARLLLRPLLDSSHRPSPGDRAEERPRDGLGTQHESSTSLRFRV